ncbi:MAG: flagellar basal-body rod protein FlgG [Bacillota bacterium]|nr:flagellar basal-body rod protein FlgG [Bacillota bacterium]
MLRALYSASSGMRAQQLNLDTISNNLANVNTNGFKKNRVDFQDLLYRTIQEPGLANTSGQMTPTGIQVGHGVRAAATPVDFTQGSLKETTNPLDLAIEGEGFFMVELPDSTIAYTRDGSFKMDAQGYLVTNNGYYVLDEGLAPIYISEDPVKNIGVASDGMISVLFPGEDVPEEIAQIGMTRFPNPTGLDKVGKNLYRATEAAGWPVEGIAEEEGMGSIVQGFLEMSNVQIVVEMVDMITAQRAYEINSKAITTSDEMLQLANNLKR